MYLPVVPIMSKHRKSLNLLDVPQHNVSHHTKASLHTQHKVKKKNEINGP